MSFIYSAILVKLLGRGLENINYSTLLAIEHSKGPKNYEFYPLVLIRVTLVVVTPINKGLGKSLSLGNSYIGKSHFTQGTLSASMSSGNSIHGNSQDYKFRQLLLR